MSTKSLPPPPVAVPVRTSKRYLMMWGGVASLALAYLTLVALRPDLAEAWLPVSSHMTRDGMLSERYIMRSQAEIRSLKQNIGELERAVADLKTELTLQGDRTIQVSARLAAFEVTTQPLLARAQEWLAQPLAVASAPASTGTAQAPAASEIVTGAISRPSKPAEPPKQKADASPSEAANASGTGATPPEAQPKGDPVALKLGTGPSIDALRLNWQLLQDGHKGALKPLQAKYMAAEGEPQTFRLIAGPVASRAEAQKLCERLKARRVTCEIGAFEGEPL